MGRQPVVEAVSALPQARRYGRAGAGANKHVPLRARATFRREGLQSAGSSTEVPRLSGL
jgi:hypothetical protein